MRAAHVCLITACLGAAVATGCGSAQTQGLSASRAAALRSELAAVTTDAGRGDRAGALAALTDASTAVSRAGGQLTSAERTALQTGIARVRSRIMATVPPPATTTTTPTIASTPTAPATTTTTATAPATTPAPGPPAGPPGRGPNGQGPPGHDHGHGPGHHPGGGGGDGGGNGSDGGGGGD
jgi:hypothetical protein